MAKRDKGSKPRKATDPEAIAELLDVSVIDTDPRAKLQAILSNAVDTLGGTAGLIALWNERERHFVEGATYGLDPLAIDKLRPLLGGTISDLATSEQSFDSLFLPTVIVISCPSSVLAYFQLFLK